MSDCCSTNTVKKKRPDFLLWGSSLVLLCTIGAHVFFREETKSIPFLSVFAESAVSLLSQMWWGLALGILFVGVLDAIPRNFVMAVLGRKNGINGIVRATSAGVLLDLCSHGILVVGMKLYERGASLGQVMAFLIASPWNSFSLTLILWSLVGFWWMISFLLLSMAIAIVSGLIFEALVAKNILPKNPHRNDIPDDFFLWNEIKKQFSFRVFTPQFFLSVGKNGIKGSKMILRWIFFGVVLAAAIRTFVPPESFSALFGPTLLGLGLTLVVATILEVCSEGSTPIAADILTRAAAPGNAFAFLMTGVSTDYTEIMALKETTKSWKIAFFLPLVTLPQVLLLGILLNSF